jgi:hypothetical protein
MRKSGSTYDAGREIGIPRRFAVGILVLPQNFGSHKTLAPTKLRVRAYLHGHALEDAEASDDGDVERRQREGERVHDGAESKRSSSGFESAGIMSKARGFDPRE